MNRARTTADPAAYDDQAAERLAAIDTAGARLATRSVAQIKYGQVLARQRSARLYFMNAMRTAWQRTRAGETCSDADKADLYLTGVHAVQSAAEAVRLVIDAAATSTIFCGQPLERILRDMEVLRHHGFTNETRYGGVAQVHWGAELDCPLMLR